MGTVVQMPRLSPQSEVVKIIHTDVAIGKKVRSGDVLAEVETDKATLSILVPEDGTVLAMYFKVGDKINVGTNICVIGEEHESVAQILQTQEEEVLEEVDTRSIDFENTFVLINGQQIALGVLIKLYYDLSETLDLGAAHSPDAILRKVKKLKRSS